MHRARHALDSGIGSSRPTRWAKGGTEIAFPVAPRRKRFAGPLRFANRSRGDLAPTWMTEPLTFVVFLAAWIVLQRFVLPRFGVPT